MRPRHVQVLNLHPNPRSLALVPSPGPQPWRPQGAQGLRRGPIPGRAPREPEPYPHLQGLARTPGSGSLAGNDGGQGGLPQAPLFRLGIPRTPPNHHLSRGQGRACPACTVPVSNSEKRFSTLLPSHPLDLLQGPCGSRHCRPWSLYLYVILPQMVTIFLSRCQSSSASDSGKVVGLENPRQSLSFGVSALRPGSGEAVRGSG